jgi:hypothetical protein
MAHYPYCYHNLACPASVAEPLWIVAVSLNITAFWGRAKDFA